MMRDYHKVIIRLAASLLAVLFLTACEKTPEPTVVGFAGGTMGTSYSVKWLAADVAESEKVKQQIAELNAAADLLLIEVNQSMSTYIADSELSLLNRAKGDVQQQISQPLFNVLQLSQDISRASRGAFDVTVGPLVNLWGFGPDGRVTKAPEQSVIDELRSKVGFQRITLDTENVSVSRSEGVYIDLSAVAKGYGVDRLAQLMDANGVMNYLVEIGGELRAKGLKLNSEPWLIAIESPVSGQRAIQRIIGVRDIAVATSGDYRNYFEENGVRFSHTIDPSNGRPINHKLASVTVLRPSCAEADALATAFTVMGELKAYEYAIANGIDAMFIVKSDTGFIEKQTPGFATYLVE